MLTKKQIEEFASDNNLDYNRYHAIGLTKDAFESTLQKAYAAGAKDMQDSAPFGAAMLWHCPPPATGFSENISSQAQEDVYGMCVNGCARQCDFCLKHYGKA